MTGYILLALAIFSLILFFYSVNNRLTVQICELEGRLKLLLQRGLENGLLTIKPVNQHQFIQLRKYIKTKGEFGIRLDFPNSEWSTDYYKGVQEALDKLKIQYAFEYGSDGMQFLTVDFKKNIEMASTALQAILRDVFLFNNEQKYKVQLDNASPWDELIDAPGQLPMTFREARIHKKRSQKNKE